MTGICCWVKLANKVMENYNVDHRWPPNYVCQEKRGGVPDCPNCMVYRVARYDLEAISLYK